MTTKLQFQKGASVQTKNGIEVGTVDRVVVYRTTNALAGIVVRNGGLLKSDERIVPTHLVADATEEVVHLREEAGDLESMMPFEEQRLVGSGEGSNQTPPVMDDPPLIMGAPVMGLPVPQVREPRTHLEQNIPEGTVALKEGSKVITAEGKHVGNVERVLADPSSANEVTHLLISKGFLTKEKKLIPMKWVRSLDENRVHLRVKQKLVDKLAGASLAM